MPGEQILQPWAFPVLIFLGCSLPSFCWEASSLVNQGRLGRGWVNCWASIQMLFKLASQPEPTVFKARYSPGNATPTISSGREMVWQ